jgi:hypothetical protein
VTNGTSSVQTQNVAFNESVQLQNSWTVTRGVSVGANVGFSIKGIINIGVSTTLTFNETRASSVTESRGFTTSMAIPVKPHTRVVATLTLDELELDVPFSAELVVGGSLHYVNIGPHPLGSPIPPGFPGAPYAVAMGVGVPFLHLPHPAVKVISQTEISVRVEGQFKGVHGKAFNVATQEFDLDSPGLEPGPRVQILSVSME